MLCFCVVLLTSSPTVYYQKRQIKKEQIITFERLEDGNVWYFGLKNYLSVCVHTHPNLYPFEIIC